MICIHSGTRRVQDSYIFKVGWKDWRPIEDGYEELGITGSLDSQERTLEEAAQRRMNAPRVGVSGRVVVHNDGQLSIGNGVNISATGIFVDSSKG